MKMDSFDEDGEIREEMRHHPHRTGHHDEHDEDEFSMSSYDGEQTDSLVIKPPQAVAQRREKKEKREKRDRHRHKGERHKERHRNREISSSHEERREHRRHRERDPERREARRHEKHRERAIKHERPTGDLRNKLDKDRKLIDREQERRKDRPREREREEFYIDDREMYDARQKDHVGSRGSVTQLGHHRDRRHEERANSMQGNLAGLQLSPREKAEREKRMERFMVAEKQKEMSRREADVRRQRREEERREEKRMEDLRQRAEASMLRNAAGRIATSPVFHGKKRKKLHLEAVEEPETVELSDDDDDEKMSNDEQFEDNNEDEKIDDNLKRKKKMKREEVIEEEKKEENEIGAESNRSSSSESGPTSDTGSSSSTSSDEDDDDDDDDDEDDDDDDGDDEEANEDNQAEKSEEAISSKGDKYNLMAHSPTNSASSTDESFIEKENDNHSYVGTDTEEKGFLGESPPASPKEVKEELPSYYPAIMGCRSVDEFECLNRIEEGTYGVVYRAREKASNEIVALKRLKMEKEKEGFPITSLREVNTLLKGQHENIVTVREIVVGSNMDKIYIVMDYVEHDLKSLMETMRQKKQAFTIGEVKTLMMQLLRAVHHLHDNWILHRDLKTSNLLLSHRGILKVGDFGLAREYGSPLKQYTPIVVTLWYRAPELLLGTKEYSCPIDVWSLGCIFGELLGMEPMFPGKSEIDQLNKIFKDLGTPSDKIWPGYSQMPVIKKTQFAYYPYNHLKERFKTRLSIEGFKLLNSFLTYNPAKRITCAQGLQHDYFHVEEPAPIVPAMFPTWPAKSENPHGRAKKGVSPKPPSGGKNFKDLGDGEDESIAGFFLGGAPSSGPGFTLKF